MKRVVVAIPFAALILAVLCPAVIAQTTSRESVDFRHATSLGISGGGAIDTAGGGPVAGATLGWQLSRSVAVEGVGRWYSRGKDSDAFSSALLLQTDVISSGDARVFISGGLGVYRVSFGPGAQMSMPAFYQRRMGARASGPVTQATFTDPAVVLGGGMKFALTRHLSLRPAVDTIVVPVRSRYHYVTSVAVSLAYRFEHHPVTAVRRPQ